MVTWGERFPEGSVSIKPNISLQEAARQAEVS
jgi:hypothetical protein